jgi:uncharacterized protein
MHTYTIRFKPNQDLRQGLEDIVRQHNIRAGIILTMVGSLKMACLRVNGGTELTKGGPFEIVSATGTLGIGGLHVHLSIAEADGKVIGGHLKRGCNVHTTVEVVIGHIIEEEFHRVADNQTGYDELQVRTAAPQ